MEPDEEVKKEGKMVESREELGDDQAALLSSSEASLPPLTCKQQLLCQQCLDISK